MQCGGLSPVALLLKISARGAHSHKEPCPCKLGVNLEGSGRTEGMGTLSQSCRLFLYLLPLTPSFYLLNIEICLGLDGADGGWSPRGLPSPLAQRNGCQEQGEEQHSPRGQHGGPVGDSRRQDREVEECTVRGQSPLSSAAGSTAQEVHICLPFTEPLPQARVILEPGLHRGLALRPKCEVCIDFCTPIST